ncbi:glycosyltransferase family 2 protein [Glaesserella parasuis]|uniref:glycosyltransferase family 2 protein n=1 Tax=Glaesserella parasuis TaxID=738 RepID=UPI001328122E|nr:glycosyltransferase family 2 protein [Glaesserella parasuis]MWP98792.1 glycosyltransferase family 2 protein [Glaesserella parasuis]MWQ44108.1 glycosyltransferase family 2 protein [Glaesserella parasuis]MWQ60623.1 glycosyltransferase family 2 protein [Glaesserella parasuis]
MFSIIIPSYNRKNEIPALLTSLEYQTEYNFEVIIVDDHSVEPVEIKHLYPFPVNVIRNEQNLGAAESRNVGARFAENEWLLFLDDDDRFAHPKCEILAKTINENPTINFIYHPSECVMVNEGFSYITRPYENEQAVTLENILLANKVGGMPMIAIKKSFFFAVNGLSTDLKSLEDYDFILKVISHNEFKPKHVSQALTTCTFHTKRASVSTNTQNTELAIETIKQKYVKTDIQQKNFAFNALYMLSYPHIMNLSRKAACYYWQMFLQSKNIKHLVIATLIFISPKLAINMKRFI